jgi:hypothetical membrane protein
MPISTSVGPDDRTAHPARRARARVLAVTAAVSATLFITTLALAGGLDPGYSHLSEGISALASDEAEAAGVMTVGFLFLAATAVASGAALGSTLPDRVGRAAAGLVILAGLITAAEGFLRQSCSSLQSSCRDREAAGGVSGAHVLHDLSAMLLFVMLVAAGFLAALALTRDERLRSLARATLVGAALSLVFMVWFGSGAYGELGGVVQLPVTLALALATTQSRAVEAVQR